MNSRLGVRGALRGIGVPVGKALDLSVAVAFKKSVTTTRELAALQVQRCRRFHVDSSQTSPAIAGSKENDTATSSAGTTTSTPSLRIRVEWPADMSERARRIASNHESGSAAPMQGSQATSSKDLSTFISKSELEEELEVNDARAFWRRVKSAISWPLSTAATNALSGAAEASNGAGSPPILYKRYVDGMTAAHHYPSRLLPPNESQPLPPLFFVTPFSLQDSLDHSAQVSRLGFGKMRGHRPSVTGMHPKTAVSCKMMFPCISVEFLSTG